MKEQRPAKGWKRREIVEASALALATSSLPFPVIAASPGATAHPDVPQLARLFADPPLRAKPGCYWYWMGGAVTDVGITRDLEEMKKAGIGTAMLFSIGKAGEHPQVTPPADALTETWWARVAHAAREADRLGVELAFNACDGWATASGPWITPELSMQHVVWSERFVDGGAEIDADVPQPDALLGYYRDIATLALPVGDGWEETNASRHAHVISDLPITDFAKLTDTANLDQVVETDTGGFFQFVFDRPFTLRSVTVRTAHATSGYAPGVYRAANSLWVEASDDGVTFRPVGRLDYPEHGWQTDMTTLTHALPPTSARMFRLVHKPEGPFGYQEERDFGQDATLKLSSLTLSSMPAIQSLAVKSGEQWGRARRMSSIDMPDVDCVPLGASVALAGGGARWKAPKGRWRLLRIGYTTTGKGNSAAGAGQGLECSRFERAAVDAQYDGWFGKVRDRLGPIGKAIGTLHVDSWEAGTQNWSPRFAEEFRARRGYDLLPWLPVMAGVPMVSADATERVLFDVRRTIADLVRDIFYATLSARTQADGVRFTGEPASPTFPVDGLDYGRFLDMPMGEFWYKSPRNDKPNDIKDAVSGGRIYGRSVIGAESFTEVLIDWTEQPAKWKALGDHNWCEGVNRLMLHVWAGQPWPDRGPGMTLSGIGTQMNYLQSWWKPGKSWFDYLGRSQALLQQGRAVADIAYFIGEDIPTRALLPRQLRPALPSGYAYDSINRDALLRLATVEDGWIVLPGGARYRLLVLRDTDRMTPELATKLAEFARAGVLISGPRPKASPSLASGGHADATVQRIAEVLWGGRLIADHADLIPVLAKAKLAPDLQIKGAEGVEWTHRQGPGWDLYFLSNQTLEPIHFTARARVSGRAPELWDSEHGRATALGQWVERDGLTDVPLKLDGNGSVFLLFAQPSASVQHIGTIAPAMDDVSIVRSAKAVQLSSSTAGRWSVDGKEVSLASVPPPHAIDGPWLVRFADRLKTPKTVRIAALSSWTEQADPDLRFYSGVATYSTMLTLPNAGDADTLWLDLGRVESLASVRLNGRDLGSLFKPPFLIDISDAVRMGRNQLEIDVANTWRNRIIGDDGKSDAERTSFIVPMLRKGQKWLPGAGAALDPAGLLGPVRIITRRAVDIA